MMVSEYHDKFPAVTYNNVLSFVVDDGLWDSSKKVFKPGSEVLVLVAWRMMVSERCTSIFDNIACVL
jgi:hypothetical protein